MSIVVRDAAPADFARITEIYAHHVCSGFGTFEEAPPSVEEMLSRFDAVTAAGLPYLVAAERGAVFGYAYAAPYRPRSAYRFTVEDLIYVAPEAQRRGIGAPLLMRLVERSSAAGMRQMIAVIGDSANAGSIGLHRSLGYEDAGVGRGFGFKFGRWVDVVWMQKTLGPGSEAPPVGEGLAL